MKLTAAIPALVFRHRSTALLPAAAPILLGVLQPEPLAASVAALGLSLAAGGVAIRLWAVRSIGKRARVRRAGAKQLLVAGPYARVRNPLYLGNAALTLGLALLAGARWGALLSLLVLVVVYALVVRHEERVLAGQFGEEYAVFVASVPRWRPRLRPASLQGAGVEPWSWREVLWREASPFLGVPAACAALLAAQAGLFPVGAWVAPLEEPAPLPALVGGALLVAATATVVSTEVKQRRHARARARAARAPATAPRAGLEVGFPSG